jgi:hypothetical protein
MQQQNTRGKTLMSAAFKAAQQNKAATIMVNSRKEKEVEKVIKMESEEEEDEDDDTVVILDQEIKKEDRRMEEEEEEDDDDVDVVSLDDQPYDSMQTPPPRKTKGRKSTAATAAPKKGRTPTVRKAKSKTTTTKGNRGRKKKDKTEKDKTEKLQKKWWLSLMLPQIKEDEAKKEEIMKSLTLYGAAIDTDNLTEESMRQKAQLHRSIHEGMMKKDKIIEIILLGYYDQEAYKKLLNNYMDEIVKIVVEHAVNNPKMETTVQAMTWIRECDENIYKVAAIFFMIHNERKFPGKQFLSFPKLIGGKHVYEMSCVNQDTFVPFVKLLSSITDQHIASKDADHNTVVRYALDCCVTYFTLNSPPYV